MIEFKNVNKIYKTKKGIETKALNNINLKIGNIGMVFIVGKSGSGKSTMLNLLGGLDAITSGELLINNQNISNFKNKQYDAYRNTYIGFIFQEFNILEEYNVYENINLALKLQNKKSTKFYNFRNFSLYSKARKDKGLLFISRQFFLPAVIFIAQT